MANDFFEYKPSQYVSAFQPLDLGAIHGAMQEKQERADKSNTLFANLMSQMNEVPTRDPELYHQAMGNIKNAFDEIYKGSHGDLSGSYNKINNLISQARSDPFWKLNESKVKAADEQERLVESIKSQGKTPLMFKDVTKAPLLNEHGEYASPNSFNFDVAPQLEYEQQMSKVWDEILRSEGFEDDFRPSKTMKGKMEAHSWDGISEHQVGNKRKTAFQMYQDTDEYRQQKKYREQNMPNSLTDEQIEQNLYNIGKAKTGIKSSIKITNNPDYMGGYGAGVNAKGVRWAQSEMNLVDTVLGKSYDDLSKLKPGDSNYGSKILMQKGLISNSPTIKKSFNEATAIINSILTNKAIDKSKYPELAKFLDTKNKMDYGIANIEEAIADLSKFNGDEVQPFHKSIVTDEEGNKLYEAEHKLIAVNKGLTDAFNKIKDNPSAIKGQGIYGYQIDELNSPKPTEARSDQVALDNTLTDAQLGDLKINGEYLKTKWSDIHGAHVFVDPETNEMQIVGDITTGDGSKKKTAYGQMITIDNPTLVNRINQNSGGIFTNSLQDRHYVDGNVLTDKKSGEKVKLQDGVEAKKVSTDNGYYYTVSKDSKPLSMYDYNRQVHQMSDTEMINGIKQEGEQVAYDQGLTNQEKLDWINKHIQMLNSPMVFSNTSEIQQYYGR